MLTVKGKACIDLKIAFAPDKTNAVVGEIKLV